jgi:hypothetical protein
MEELLLEKITLGIGFTYDEDRDAFIPKKPYNSWILNEQHLSTGKHPVAYPSDASIG